jgi:hypothetical protein
MTKLSHFRNIVNVLKKPCGNKVGYMSPSRNSCNARVIVILRLQHGHCYVKEVDGTVTIKVVASILCEAVPN